MIVIYLITETETGRQYVGQTSRSLSVRFGQHATCRRADMPIAVAMAAAGRDAFTIGPLETCPSQVEANRTERDWIIRLGTLTPEGFNVSVGVGRRPETAARISAALKGRQITWKDKLSAAAKGRPSTPAQRASLALGRLGVTPERRRLMSLNNSHRRLSSQDEEAIVNAYAAGGVSQQVLADRFGVGQSAISKVIRRTRLMLPQED